MNTPRDLMSTSWQRYKELVLLKGSLEDYVLFTVAKLGSFAAGIGMGYWMWGV